MSYISRVKNIIFSLPGKIIDRVVLFKYVYQLIGERSSLLENIVDRENNFYPKKIVMERKYIGTGITDVIMETKIKYWDKKRDREGYIADKLMERLIPIIEKSLIEYYGKNRRQD
jgi:hypothetical protein